MGRVVGEVLELSCRTLAKPGGQSTTQPCKSVTVGLLLPPCGQCSHFFPQSPAKAGLLPTVSVALNILCRVDWEVAVTCGAHSLR